MVSPALEQLARDLTSQVKLVKVNHTIVGVEASGRLARLLVRLSGPIHDPAWTVRDVTLEELVLAYMSHPDTTLPIRLKRKAIHP